MPQSLLIVGAGIYGRLVKEIASDIGCFEKIDFLDDNSKVDDVVGRTDELEAFVGRYDEIIVAIGNPDIRSDFYEKIVELPYNIATLISNKAYVSPSAIVGEGCVIEPMAVIHTECEIKKGCFISAGAVVNHAAVCEEFVHIDCNATVEGFATVDKKNKVSAGCLYKKKLK